MSMSYRRANRRRKRIRRIARVKPTHPSVVFRFLIDNSRFITALDEVRGHVHRLRPMPSRTASLAADREALVEQIRATAALSHQAALSLVADCDRIGASPGQALRALRQGHSAEWVRAALGLSVNLGITL